MLTIHPKKATLEPKVGNGATRTPPHCPIEEGRTSTAHTIIAHIALPTRSFLERDGKAERFTDIEAANLFLSYKYRAPYKLG